MADQIKTAFNHLQLGIGEPYGSLDFKIQFARVWFSYRPEENIRVNSLYAELLEAVIDTCQRKSIKVPRPFYHEKENAEWMKGSENDYIIRPAQTRIREGGDPDD